MDLDDLLEEHENAADSDHDPDALEEPVNRHEDATRNVVDQEGQSQREETSETVKPKKKKQGTSLTLDHQKLCGERGIPILQKHFENVKFKGKGHEKEDLAKLMFHLEHWGHRLFPRLTFDDILDRVEWLGTKKSVKNCLTKIRLDMPILSEDFVSKESGDCDENEEQVAMANQPSQLPEVPAEDLFEQFMQDYESGNVEVQSEQTSEVVFQSATAVLPTASPGLQISGESLVSDLGTQEKVLPPHVQERIERNKRLAEERRKARMAQLQSAHRNEQQSATHGEDETPRLETDATFNENHCSQTTYSESTASPVPKDNLFPNSETSAPTEVDNSEEMELLDEDALLSEIEKD